MRKERRLDEVPLTGALSWRELGIYPRDGKPATGMKRASQTVLALIFYPQSITKGAEEAETILLDD